MRPYRPQRDRRRQDPQNAAKPVFCAGYYAVAHGNPADGFFDLTYTTNLALTGTPTVQVDGAPTIGVEQIAGNILRFETGNPIVQGNEVEVGPITGIDYGPNTVPVASSLFMKI